MRPARPRVGARGGRARLGIRPKRMPNSYASLDAVTQAATLDRLWWLASGAGG
jgi:hypothetical protein